MTRETRLRILQLGLIEIEKHIRAKNISAALAKIENMLDLIDDSIDSEDEPDGQH